VMDRLSRALVWRTPTLLREPTRAPSAQKDTHARRPALCLWSARLDNTLMKGRPNAWGANLASIAAMLRRQLLQLVRVAITLTRLMLCKS